MPVDLAALGLRVSAAELTGFLLVMARLGALWSASGIPIGRNAQLAARWTLTMAMAFLVRPSWPVVALPGAAGAQMTRLAVLAVSEVAYGLVLGLAVAMLFDALQLAAHVVSLQAGYGFASTIDPASDADSGVLLVVAQVFGWLLFAACGLDRELVRVLATSFERHGPGVFWIDGLSVQAIVAMGQAVLETALRLALPIAGLMVIIDLAIAALGRLQAQLQLLSITFPVKMLLTLAVLAALLPAIAAQWQSLAGCLVVVLAGGLG